MLPEQIKSDLQTLREKGFFQEAGRLHDFMEQQSSLVTALDRELKASREQVKESQPPNWNISPNSYVRKFKTEVGT